MVRPPFAHFFHCARRRPHPDLCDLPDLLFHRLCPEPREVHGRWPAVPVRLVPEFRQAVLRQRPGAFPRQDRDDGRVRHGVLRCRDRRRSLVALPLPEDHKLGRHAGPADLSRHGHFHRLGPGRLAALRQFDRHAAHNAVLCFRRLRPAVRDWNRSGVPLLAADLRKELLPRDLLHSADGDAARRGLRHEDGGRHHQGPVRAAACEVSASRTGSGPPTHGRRASS